MKILIKQDVIFSSILKKPKVCEESCYRKFFYIKTIVCDEGVLAYNLVTGELLFLDKFEGEILLSKPNDNVEVRNILIEKLFLVPVGHDDKTFSNQVRDMLLSINRMNINRAISNFVIFPTTDCNARCFYCFELNGSRKKMDEQIADDVVDFIVRKSNGKKVNIRWFGGEPLYNDKAIDIICEGLNKKNIEFTSRMISNAYLFDDRMVAKAVDLWKLKWIQVTLDGTEEVYNKIKAYIYEEGSAFKRVIGNIERLLQEGISVTVRLNMDDYNTQDLYSLTDQLYDKFSIYSNFNMYSNLLFEESSFHTMNRSDDDRYKLMDSHLRLQNYIFQKGLLRNYPLRKNDHLSHCMADSNNTILIYPDGNLGKCQHYTEDHFVGSIYSDEFDMDMINWFKDLRIVEDRCDECDMKPWCTYPVCCFSVPSRCDDFDKGLRTQILENRILDAYKEFKKGENNED